jgi:hypothetical protein
MPVLEKVRKEDDKFKANLAMWQDPASKKSCICVEGGCGLSEYRT